jgi:hypothetical protein
MDIDKMRRTFLSDDDLRRIGVEVLALDLDTVASGELGRTSRKGARLLVRVNAAEKLTVHAVLRRGARVVSQATAVVLPGQETVALRLPAGASGKHVLEVELEDVYDNATRLRRTIRLAAA